MADPAGTISYDLTFSGGPAEQKFYCDQHGSTLVVTSGSLALQPIETKELFKKLTMWLKAHSIATVTVTVN